MDNRRGGRFADFYCINWAILPASWLYFFHHFCDTSYLQIQRRCEGKAPVEMRKMRDIRETKTEHNID